MTYTHLVSKRSKSSIHFHFRSKIPTDLIQHFNSRKQFQILLNNVSNKESLLLSLKLKSIVQQLYSDIRSGMNNLTLEDIKEILRIEVRKSILYSHQVSEESNKHSERGVHKSIGHVLDLETQLKQKMDSNLGEYRKDIELKLEKILTSLDIKVDKGSVDFKKLRNKFIDLYLIRLDWMKELINNTGRSDDDFRKEVDEKLNMSLFTELTEQEIQSRLQVSESILGSSGKWNLDKKVSQRSKHQSNSISKGIKKFISEKYKLTSKSEMMMKSNLEMLIEKFGDIFLIPQYVFPIGMFVNVIDVPTFHTINRCGIGTYPDLMYNFGDHLVL